MKIEVKPLPIVNWHSKSKIDSFKRPIAIQALFDTNTSKYGIDMNDEEIKEYSEKLSINLDPTFNYNKPHDFYDSSQGTIKLENSTMIFDTDKARDYVLWKILRASPFIANSLEEWEKGNYPEATHYIHDEESEASIKASKYEVKQSCFVEAAKLPMDEKINLAIILSDKVLRGRSANFVNVAINDIIDSNPAAFLRYVKMDKIELNIRATIIEALKKNILTKEGLSIVYMGQVIAVDFEEAVSWFKDKNNQKLKLAIMEKLSS